MAGIGFSSLCLFCCISTRHSFTEDPDWYSCVRRNGYLDLSMRISEIFRIFADKTNISKYLWEKES